MQIKHPLPFISFCNSSVIIDDPKPQGHKDTIELLLHYKNMLDKGEITQEQFFEQAQQPLREFMEGETRTSDLNLFHFGV